MKNKRRRYKHSKKQKSGSKSIIRFAAVSVLIIAVIIFITIFSLKNKPANINNESGSVNSAVSVASITNGANSATNESDLISYNSVNSKATNKNPYLTVVNSNSKLSASFVPNTAEISGKYTNPLGLQFESSAIKYLENMLFTAHNDGVNLMVISAYCSYNKQLELYNEEVINQTKINPNYSNEEAKAAAAKIVEAPSTSEMQLGLTVYFNQKNTSFENSDEFKWLNKNAEEFGFILRYPKNKTKVTGKEYMPYCWRFVGTENAKNIKKTNLTLEEFTR